MKQFCETASIFELDNVKNEASLRGFLIFRSWQRQKRSNYARRPSKIESWLECRADGLVPMRFAMFPLHLSKVLRLPRESDVRSYKVLHLSRKIMLPKLKIQCSKMQPLSGNQTPDLPTSLPREIYFCRSSSNVPRLPSKCSKTFTFCSLLTRCTIPCACHAKSIFADPLQMSHACHRNAAKPSRFAHFWQGAQSLAPATRNDIWTSKSGPNM